MSRASLNAAARTGVDAHRVEAEISSYTDLYVERSTADDRKSAYTRMVNQYYDLVTDFYEYGWGQSFHFAPRHRGESFADSLKRYEHTLAARMRLSPGDRVLDVGCGVGGPMRNIARLVDVHITGLNNNDYQIRRATEHNAAAGLSTRCDLRKGDFMRLPFDAESFEGCYQIEATCHAPDRVGVFSEIFRVLKPGAVFAGYEWVLTDLYDPDDPEHVQVIRDVEEGDALPELTPASVVDEALKAAGFEQIDCRDVAPTSDPETPWYLALSGKERGLQGFARSRIGRSVTHTSVRTLETLRLAPKGSTAVSALLNKAADALVRAGELGIFTPMYLHVARKPL